jgi:PAT family beta-lactamase induction signal transducer AmpG
VTFHLKKIQDPSLIIILALGFISGLPFLLTLSTLSFWLTESGVSKTKIGLFMLVSLPYSLKFLWAPLLDQLSSPLFKKLGKRRAWLIISQSFLSLSLFALGSCHPKESILLTAFFAFCVSFFSASQDIIIDAYRIEILNEKNRGLGAAFESIGFRFGMLASGAGALYLASIWSWKFAYWTMALGMVIGISITLFMKEPNHKKITSFPVNASLASRFPKNWFITLFWTPFSRLAQDRQEFLCLLLFIFFFKFGDTVLNSMSAPFICDLGFSKIDFANVSKVFGIALMVVGGLLGGFTIQRLGAMQSIVLCAVLQGVACLMFTVQALAGCHLGILMITVGVESLCSGMVSAVFIAYLSGFCCQPHTASHFTFLYSFGSLSRVVTSALSGYLADQLEWSTLFFLTSISIIPALIFLSLIQQQQLKKKDTSKVRIVA